MVFKRVIAMGIILHLLALVGSEGYSQEKLIYAETSEPLTLNPLNMIDTVSFRFLNLLYNSLLGIDVNMIPRAELAASMEPEVSADGKIYTFRLREDIKWHDEKPLTAEDVEFTFRMLRDSRTQTNLGGINEYIEDVRAIEPHTVQFVLRRKIPKELLFSKLTVPIIPKHLFDSNQEYICADNPFGLSKVLGTGPYAFNKWVEERGIQLVRNKSYFKGWRDLKKGDLRIDEIIMQLRRDPVGAKDALLFGGIQLLPVVRPVDYNEIRNHPDVDLVKYAWRGFSYFAYNCNREFFKDKRVRQALTYAIDREAMLKRIFGEEYVGKGLILSGPYPPGEGDPDIKPRPYDPDKAKELLKEAGFRDSDGDGILDKDGRPFEVSLKTYVKDESDRRICTLYQDQLLKIGIRLKNDQIDFMEKSKWVKEVVEERNFDIVYDTWTFAPDTDIVEDLFSSSAMRAGGNNFVSYSNPVVDRILLVNKTTPDPEVRRKNNYELHRIIHEDSPYTFLFSLPRYAGVRSSVLKCVEIHPYYFFAFITDWYMVGF